VSSGRWHVPAPFSESTEATYRLNGEMKTPAAAASLMLTRRKKAFQPTLFIAVTSDIVSCCLTGAIQDNIGRLRCKQPMDVAEALKMLVTLPGPVSKASKPEGLQDNSGGPT
jgi:hypothetical protein